MACLLQRIASISPAKSLPRIGHRLGTHGRERAVNGRLVETAKVYRKISTIREYFAARRTQWRIALEGCIVHRTSDIAGHTPALRCLSRPPNRTGAGSGMKRCPSAGSMASGARDSASTTNGASTHTVVTFNCTLTPPARSKRCGHDKAGVVVPLREVHVCDFQVTGSMRDSRHGRTRAAATGLAAQAPAGVLRQ
jgi:hypothetical protein